MKKVAAFTLLETTIAMLIAAIIIGMAYSAFSIISQSYAVYQQKHETIGGALQLKRVLTQDFIRADSIMAIPGSQKVSFRPTGIHYEIEHSFILRTTELGQDTFKFETDSLTFHLMDDAQAELFSADSPRLIDELSFYIHLNNRAMPYQFKKWYSSQNLYKPKADALY